MVSLAQRMVSLCHSTSAASRYVMSHMSIYSVTCSFIFFLQKVKCMLESDFDTARIISVAYTSKFHRQYLLNSFI